MAANYRSFFHVLGSVVALSASGLSFSADAQMLNPQEFSAVEIPDNFDVGEHITWGAKALINHSDLKEIVPVFGYRSSDVCEQFVSSFHDSELGTSLPGALLLYPEEGRAVWLDSLDAACEDQSDDQISWNYSASSPDPLAWEAAAAQIGGDLLEQQYFDSTPQPEFILTIGHLPGVTEVGSYWWRCNTEEQLTGE